MPLIVTDANGTVRLEKKPFPNEDALQQYIHEHPEAIPLDGLNANAGLLVLGREFPTESGPIDALATDRDGGVYVIETKLFKNQDRRQVLTQVLDYVAALWTQEYTADQILEAIRRDAEKRGKAPPLQRLAAFLGQDEDAAREHIETVSSKAAAGDVTAIVLMDAVDERLTTLISFLNEKSRFRVLAVELDYYAHGGLQIVSPHIHGAEARRPAASGAAGRGTWDEVRFFEDLATRTPPETQAAVRRLYSFCAGRGPIGWGTGPQRGSFNPYLVPGINKGPITAYSDGTLTLKVAWMSSDPAAQPFIDALLPALAAAGLKSDGARESKVRWDDWVTKVDGLIDALDAGLKAIPS